MKPLMRSNVLTRDPAPSMRALAELARSDPKRFAIVLDKAVTDEHLNFYTIGSLRDAFQAFYSVPVEVQTIDGAGHIRAITTSAFPVLTGILAIAQINEAYAAVPTVGQLLVTEITDPKKVTRIARVATKDVDQDKVGEGVDFPELTATEDYVDILSWRNGRIIRITSEMIEENEVADIVNRLNVLGTLAAKSVEKLTLKRVCDYDGSCATPAAPYVYRPSGSNASLFSATANTPGTRAPSGTRINTNAFADESDLSNARARLATMVDDNGDAIPIPQSELVLLCPDALIENVLKVKNSELVPGSVNEYAAWGPRGQWSGWTPVSTPLLDQLSATAWYFGAPRRQFLRKTKLDFEYVTLGENTQAFLNARIAFQARVAWDIEVGAIDYVSWVQSLTATTAPKDD